MLTCICIFCPAGRQKTVEDCATDLLHRAGGQRFRSNTHGQSAADAEAKWKIIDELGEDGPAYKKPGLAEKTSSETGCTTI